MISTTTDKAAPEDDGNEMRPDEQSPTDMPKAQDVQLYPGDRPIVQHFWDVPPSQPTNADHN